MQCLMQYTICQYTNFPYLNTNLTLSSSMTGLTPSNFGPVLLKYKSSLLKVLSVSGERDPGGRDHSDLMVGKSSVGL